MIPNRNAYEYSTRDSTPLVIEGGGGSDGEYNVTFADVTLISIDEPDSSEVITVGYTPRLVNNIIEDKEFIYTNDITVQSNGSETYKVAMLNGVGIILINDGIAGSFSITGDAEVIEVAIGTYVKVMGSATIALERVG